MGTPFEQVHSTHMHPSNDVISVIVHILKDSVTVSKMFEVRGQVAVRHVPNFVFLLKKFSDCFKDEYAASAEKSIPLEFPSSRASDRCSKYWTSLMWYLCYLGWVKIESQVDFYRGPDEHETTTADEMISSAGELTFVHDGDVFVKQFSIDAYVDNYGSVFKEDADDLKKMNTMRHRSSLLDLQMVTTFPKGTMGAFPDPTDFYKEMEHNTLSDQFVDLSKIRTAAVDRRGQGASSRRKRKSEQLASDIASKQSASGTPEGPSEEEIMPWQLKYPAVSRPLLVLANCMHLTRFVNVTAHILANVRQSSLARDSGFPPGN